MSPLQQKAIDVALKKVTPAKMNKLSNGDVIELDGEFSLTMDEETDRVQIISTDTWEELIRVFISGKRITHEIL